MARCPFIVFLYVFLILMKISTIRSKEPYLDQFFVQIWKNEYWPLFGMPIRHIQGLTLTREYVEWVVRHLVARDQLPDLLLTILLLAEFNSLCRTSILLLRNHHDLVWLRIDYFVLVLLNMPKAVFLIFGIFPFKQDEIMISIGHQGHIKDKPGIHGIVDVIHLLLLRPFNLSLLNYPNLFNFLT